MSTVHDTIRQKIKGFHSGDIIFPIDFRGVGSENAIKMALSRLAKEGVVNRIAHGIYYKPLHDMVLGELLPSVEAIVRKLADRQHIRIRPTGAFALHKLGLTTQVPSRLEYLTDGSPRVLKIGNATVEFRSTTPKKMSMRGETSSLLILALEELDLAHLHPDTEKRIEYLLRVIDQGDLQDDMRLAPGKVYNFLQKKMREPGYFLLNQVQA